ncbi:MAG: sulfite exporter TauE/SafE family protein [Fimbriimonadaceae bacterium]|nr:sulfite exporter TauE/SafE family protein [Fimbriimonadaceae bacterium]
MSESYLPLVLFVVALLYASVGHGGASGYLAALSLTSASIADSAALALAANVLVAGIAFVAFWRAGFHRPNLTWPFLVGSAPLSLVGATIKLPPGPHYALTGAVVLAAGFRTLLPLSPGTGDWRPPLPLKIGIGAGIGLLSGLVGVGGGIFLSPILVLSRWANAKEAAASSAAFIVVNSVFGLVPRAGTLTSLPTSALGLVGACFAGSLLGARLGAERARPEALKRVLGIVLVLASVKLFQRAMA